MQLTAHQPAAVALVQQTSSPEGLPSVFNLMRIIVTITGYNMIMQNVHPLEPRRSKSQIYTFTTLMSAGDQR